MNGLSWGRGERERERREGVYICWKGLVGSLHRSAVTLITAERGHDRGSEKLGRAFRNGSKGSTWR